jgi:hypothetical protein
MSEIQILKTESLIREAQLSYEWNNLSKLLSKNLIYIHSSAYVDNYESYLEKIKNKILYYQKIEIVPQTFQLHNQVAIKTSLVRGAVLVLGNEKQLNNYTTTIWLKEDGEWKLSLFQSTAIE